MSQFNLRVYGLLFNDKNQVLISIELRKSRPLIKFPGGGLEWGEGLADGLRREWQEELSVSIDVNEIYYVNEFLQMSTFHSDDQLLSFYYNIDCLTKDEIPTVTSNYKRTEEGESVAWVSLNDLNKIEFTFPVDRRVATMLFESR